MTSRNAITGSIAFPAGTADVAGSVTTGRVSKRSKMPIAEAIARRFSWRNWRSSRIGRKTSTPRKRRIISGARPRSPASTRTAPHARVTAAPTSMATFETPPSAMFRARTDIVASKRDQLRRARSLPVRPPCPNALRVGNPWMASTNSAARSSYARRRSTEVTLVRVRNRLGASRARAAKARKRSADGRSIHAMRRKMPTGATNETTSWGR